MEHSMKRIIALAFAILFASTLAISVSAQTSEAVWMTSSTSAYKTGETVLVELNTSSATPVQGFTFQIRYDPSCLRPMNASSPIPGMNGLPLPQLDGLVDGSYASTTLQTVNGILAEIRFTALQGCQTNLTLESAALAIRNSEGFAMPLPGVSIGKENLSFFIDSAVGITNDPQLDESGSILSLEPPKANQGTSIWIVGILFAIMMGLLMLGAYKVFRLGYAYEKKTSKRSLGIRRATLHIKHGPQAGKSFALNKIPILIGRDQQNDICINDPYVSSHHAQIYSKRNGYYLRDLGGGSFINGHPVRNTAVVLHPGDVVRLGKSVLFVFG